MNVLGFFEEIGQVEFEDPISEIQKFDNGLNETVIEPMQHMTMFPHKKCIDDVQSA